MGKIKALILAGGKGSRLNSLTDDMPKPLLPVNYKPLLSYVIENLRDNGIRDIVISLGYKADLVMKTYGSGYAFGVNIKYIVEEEPLGTGGAIKNSFGKTKEPFVLVFGDNLSNFNFSSMIQVHKKGTVLMSLTEREDVEHFGVVRMYGTLVQSFVEKPSRKDAPSNLINAGAFIIDPIVLKTLPDGNSSVEKDLLEKICYNGKLYGIRHAGYWFPTDTKPKLNFARRMILEEEDAIHCGY